MSIPSTTEALERAAASTAGGGKVIVSLSGSDFAAVKLRMLLAGFVEISQGSSGEAIGHKPSYATGAAVSLSKPADAWAAALASDADVARVDEHALLERDGVAAGGDCKPDAEGKRKPCKDCSCGLREIYDKGEGDVKVPEGGCGSCALGDAFRCGACPYLGLPPFKPGEKVAIPSAVMTSDI